MCQKKVSCKPCFNKSFIFLFSSNKLSFASKIAFFSPPISCSLASKKGGRKSLELVQRLSGKTFHPSRREIQHFNFLYKLILKETLHYNEQRFVMNEVLSQWMETVLNFHSDLREILPQLNSNTREILQKTSFHPGGGIYKHKFVLMSWIVQTQE